MASQGYGVDQASFFVKMGSVRCDVKVRDTVQQGRILRRFDKDGGRGGTNCNMATFVLLVPSGEGK